MLGTTMRFLLMCAFLFLFAMFGIELASRGLERIHGPIQLPSTQHTVGQQSPAGQPAASPQPDPANQPERIAPPPSGGDGLLNRTAEVTSVVLEVTAQKSIRAVVSLFDAMFQ